MELDYNQAVFETAMACVQFRRMKKCRNTFGCMVCNECKFYVKKYVMADNYTIDLFMMQATKEAVRTYGNIHGYRKGFIAVLIILGFLTVKTYQMETDYIKVVPTTKAVEIESAASTESGVTLDDIEATLINVKREMNRNIDVNGDGLNNCIDAAVTFYKYFPKKQYVSITQNYNAVTGFNHLFNCVYIDGVWKAVEPQSRYINHNRQIYMKQYWGDEYDNTKNMDKTQQYAVYAR
jgi:hypothetical protein